MVNGRSLEGGCDGAFRFVFRSWFRFAHFPGCRPDGPIQAASFESFDTNTMVVDDGWSGHVEQRAIGKMLKHT